MRSPFLAHYSPPDESLTTAVDASTHSEQLATAEEAEFGGTTALHGDYQYESSGGATLVPLRSGDVLRYACLSADAIARLRRRRGIQLSCQGQIEAWLGPGRRHRHLFEATLDAASPLIGLALSRPH